MPAPNCGFARRCSYSAPWSTIGPLATFTRMAAGFIRASSRLPSSPRVARVKGSEISRTSATASTRSRSASVPANSTGSLVRPVRLTAWMRAPNALISRAVAVPIPPKPRMPQTAPSSVSNGSHLS